MWPVPAPFQMCLYTTGEAEMTWELSPSSLALGSRQKEWGAGGWGVLPARPPFATPSGTLRSHPDLSSQGGHCSSATQYSCNKPFSYAGHCAKRWALCPQRTYNLIGPRCTGAPAANRSCFVFSQTSDKKPRPSLVVGPCQPH